MDTALVKGLRNYEHLLTKKADLLILSKSKFDSYKNFLAKKIIIKDGVVFKD